MKKSTEFFAVVVMVVFSLFFVSWADTRDTVQISSQNGYAIISDDNSVETAGHGEEYMFLAGLGKGDNYIPEMKLLVSTDNGENWVENTKNLRLGQDFYLRFDASVRVPGLRLQTFGVKSIFSYIKIPKETIITFAIADSDTTHILLARDPNDPEDFDMIVFYIPTSPLDDNAIAKGYLPKKISMILKCTPKRRGNQKIEVSYEDRVDSMYNQTFTLTIN